MLKGGVRDAFLRCDSDQGAAELAKIASALPRCSTESDEIISDGELESVLDVLAKILANPNERDSPQLLIDINLKRFRKFRKAITRVSKAINGSKARRMLPLVMEQRLKQMAKTRLQRRVQRLKNKDKQRINEATLRKRRLEALGAIEGPGSFGVKRMLTEKPSTDRLTSLEELKQAQKELERARDTAEKEELHFQRSCYICKAPFLELHHFYDQLCSDCAELNWRKRNAMADLNGKVVLLTGGRVKIGFECGKRLLRCGATVIMTSRFPYDCAKRYSELSDFDRWNTRLHMYGLDMRNIQSVVRFTDLLKRRYSRLDAIVNNAAQTVRRPPSYYRHLMPVEAAPRTLSDETRTLVKGDAHTDSASPPTDAEETSAATSVAEIPQQCAGSAMMSQVPLMPGDELHDSQSFPVETFDSQGQQIDLRQKNSWTLLLDEIDPAELVEVFAVNVVAPFILNSRLKTILLATPHSRKFIVNVSAMEGKFYRWKSPNHPHTNMAKAALNMMTRTCAQEYAEGMVFMNSVDTGWINDEYPHHIAAKRLEEKDFQTPIDEVDAMARILDPIFTGLESEETPVFGKFLKDFDETDW